MDAMISVARLRRNGQIIEACLGDSPSLTMDRNDVLQLCRIINAAADRIAELECPANLWVEHCDVLMKRIELLQEDLVDMVGQHCSGSMQGEIYSDCLSANADAIRRLAGEGKVEILEDGPGRHVIGRWKP